MNSFEQIQKNESITFLPSFAGMQVFREKQYITITQGDAYITIPVQMRDAFVDAIIKAGK